MGLISKKLIDIIASTHHFNVVKTIVFANGLSDHDLTGIIRKLNIAKYVPRQFITRNYKFYNKDNFKKDLTNIPWDSLFRLDDLNLAWNKF